MDQFEETVVNPNISLNNFEVKIREHDKNHVQQKVITSTTLTKKTNNTYKALFLLAILSSILIYQITVVL
jgi:hypothetical protein